MSQSTDITFETGYRRLQEIADRLGSDEVPVHEMCDLFAEGKGLEQALGTYLSEQRERVEAIERGEGMRAFRVVPPGGVAREGAAAAGGAGAAATVAAPSGGAAAAGAAGAAATGAAADDVPPPPQDEVLPF